MEAFITALQEDHIRLDYAALLIAKFVRYRHLEAIESLQQIDRLADAIQLPTNATREHQLEIISHYLFDEIGFCGNQRDYYDPANSFLNDVLDLKQGIPITLSVIYMAVAARLDIPMYGVGLPGHFVISADDSIFVDPFDGGRLLTREECIRIGRGYLPSEMPFSSAFLEPQPSKLILLRILNNLRQIYIERRDLSYLVRVLQLQEIIVPQDVELKRDLGLLYIQLKWWGASARALRQYIYLRPDAPDKEVMQKTLNEALSKLSKLN